MSIKLNNTNITTLYHRNLSDTSVWGKVDLGSLSWTKNAYCFEAPLTYAPNKSYDFGVCTKYPMSKIQGGYSEMLDKTMVGRKTGLIVYIRDDSYTDAESFKAAMLGVYLWYELSTNTKPTKMELTKVRKNTSNVWDEEWENGILSDTTGEPVSGNAIRSKNFIPILPNQKYCFVKRSGVAQRAVYYDENKNFISFVDQIATNQPYTVFTTPSNAHYYKFYVLEITYNHDIAINYPSSITTYSPHYVTVFNKLPREYQEVEYLESSGTQYISIPQGIKTNPRMVIKYASPNIEFINYIAGLRYYIAIARGATGNYNHLYGTTQYSRSAATADSIHTSDISGSRILFDGEIVTNSPTAITHDFPNTLYVFSWSTSERSYAKIYSLTMYSDTTKTLDLIPCYRKLDNVAGMYDLVNGVFYTNQGTGSFIVGRDID